jgi:ABC-type transport system substrate-binding protein
MKLGFKQDCDKESGATSFITCDAILNTEFGTDLSAKVTYIPGFQDPTYFTYPFYIYPSHQKLADGRTLADVPAKEWSTLAEVAEKPLGWGPFMVEDWKKGESITLVANPYADPAPKVKKVIVKIIPDTNQAVAQLLSGDVDYLDTSTLGAGAEVQTVLDAAKAGKIKAVVVPSTTWEHIDFNLFTK